MLLFHKGLDLGFGEVGFHLIITLGSAAAANLLKSCPTLCDPIDGSPLGYPVPGILQARTLEWVAISFSKAWKWKVKVKSLSHSRLLATPWTAAYQAPLSMGFSRQEYWSGVPLPSPGQKLRDMKTWEYMTSWIWLSSSVGIMEGNHNGNKARSICRTSSVMLRNLNFVL